MVLYTLNKNVQKTMLQEISLSDARRRLSALLREIEADPGAGYRILVRKRVVAELRSPAPTPRYHGWQLHFRSSCPDRG
jgi:antitoxin (DNA-binding transcriptional repressor) of toxin-antitoxin stability system